MPTLFRLFLVAFCICFAVVAAGAGLHIPAIQAQSGPELLVDCVVAAALGTALYSPLSALLEGVQPELIEADEAKFEFDIITEETEVTQ